MLPYEGDNSSEHRVSATILAAKDSVAMLPFCWHSDQHVCMSLTCFSDNHLYVFAELTDRRLDVDEWK